MRNRGQQRTPPLWSRRRGLAARFATAAGWWGGHPTRCPRLDTRSFRYLATARPPAGKGAKKTTQAPCIPHQGIPWTRFLGRHVGGRRFARLPGSQTTAQDSVFDSVTHRHSELLPRHLLRRREEPAGVGPVVRRAERLSASVGKDFEEV